MKVEGLKMRLKVYPEDNTDYKQGDANNDGKVDNTDQYVIMDTIAAGLYDEHCDVNTDGRVTVADIVALLDILNNMD